VATLAFPLLGAMTLAGLALTVAQKGGVLSFTRGDRGGRDRAERRFGLARLFDGTRFSRLLIGVLAASALLVTLWLVMVPLLPGIARLMDSPGVALAVAGRGLTTLLVVASTVVAVVATLDWFTRRADWLRRLRMSPAELKAERREDEGAPELRRARRRTHEELG
jgi:flagellar biosynthesis protein FlhB